MMSKRKFTRKSKDAPVVENDGAAPIEPLESPANRKQRLQEEQELAAQLLQQKQAAKAAQDRQAREAENKEKTDQAAAQQARDEAERQAQARQEAAETAAAQKVLDQEKRAKAKRLAQIDQARIQAERPAQPALVFPKPWARMLPDDAWNALPSFKVDAGHLTRKRIITAEREDPAHTAFDVLRTRLLQAMSDNGWTRVAITSPTKDCGKTFTAANLAISLSRQENCRTMLFDFDMRRPNLHHVLGVPHPGSIGAMLRREVSVDHHLLRIGNNTINAGRNIAFGMNDTPEPYASELLQDPNTARTLDLIEEQLEPDVMLFDLPPALYYDDVIAFRPLFDGVLLVLGGGTTTEKEVKEVERRLGDTTPLLGMVLNKAENTQLTRYRY